MVVVSVPRKRRTTTLQRDKSKHGFIVKSNTMDPPTAPIFLPLFHCTGTELWDEMSSPCSWNLAATETIPNETTTTTPTESPLLGRSVFQQTEQRSSSSLSPSSGRMTKTTPTDWLTDAGGGKNTTETPPFIQNVTVHYVDIVSLC